MMDDKVKELLSLFHDAISTIQLAAPLMREEPSANKFLRKADEFKAAIAAFKPGGGEAEAAVMFADYLIAELQKGEGK